MTYKGRVVVGMSGGVDSSVAALLLKKEGYDVIGVFMKNYSDKKNPLTGECSWKEEKRMAQLVAAILEIPFFVVDYEKKYKREIIESMFKDYAKGLTPNPDILCNKIVKFPALWTEAKKLKADYVATGHYAQIKKTKNGFELLQGIDKKKDQSYFLYQLSQNELAHTLFPVGKLKKEKVREIAKQNSFPNWNKKGTSGICFVGKIDMKEFLRKKIQEKRGKVFSPDGEIIGTHPGAMYFTIGERIGISKGFKLNDKIKIKKKLYVAEKRKNNILIVAPRGHFLLKMKKVFIKEIHFINLKEKIPREKLKARVRHLGKLHSGRLIKENARWIFHFKKPIVGIAEGQFIVIYRGEKVVGGGEMRLR